MSEHAALRGSGIAAMVSAAWLLSAMIAIGLAAGAAQAHAQGGWWRPQQRLSWYWQLQGTVENAEPVAAYDIDGFENSAAEVAALHALGKHVICYVYDLLTNAKKKMIVKINEEAQQAMWRNKGNLSETFG